MDRTLTMDVKSILIAGVVLLGLLTAYLLGAADDDGPGAAAVAAEETGDDPRRVVMAGRGTVTAVPDELSFSVSVHATEPDVSTAMDDANATMAKVLAALRPYGVTKRDQQSTGLSIDPQYDYPAYAAPVLTGYRVSQSARITVGDLRQAGKAISATVRAGGNAVRVRGIRLGLRDPAAVLARARDEAVAEATDKARQYAEATGQELGEVLSLHEVTPRRYGVGRSLAAFKMADAELATGAFEAVPIRAGEEEVAVTVEVVWSFV